MLAVVLVVGKVAIPDPAHPTHPEGTIVGEARSIPSEAGVFRAEGAVLAVPPDAEASHVASQRSLASFRSLRAYPGAPPRIPHELSEDEFRTTQCTVCHERGGYSSRFAAYTPVTPHPEFENCLQCHVPEQSSSDFVQLDWRPEAWPPVGQRAMEGSPPWIPHDLQMRGNCLSCHGGPSAVAEIRTTHPERANCRQCHVTTSVPEVGDVFTRSSPVESTRPGGDR